MLTDIADQVLWPIWMGNGFVDQALSKEDWKSILTAGLKSSQRMAKAIEGNGFVALGEPTSKMSKQEMNELTDFIEYFGDSREPPVQWTEPQA